MDKKKILVTASTGNLGRSVVKALLDKGFDVVATATDPQKKPTVCGLPTRKFVFEDIQTVKEALQGCTGLFLIAPPLDDQAASKLNPAIDAAKAQGVEHIVLNTAIGVDQAQGSPLNNVEKHLKASGVQYSILRPNFFMENFSTGFAAPMIQQGGIFLAAADAATSFIAVEDIAAVGATCFAKNLFGAEYTLTGPESLNHTQVAQIISKYSAKPVSYHALTAEQMEQSCRDNKMPESAVKYLSMLYAAVRMGYTANTTLDVQTVTGRAATSFDAFARRAFARQN